MIVDATAAARRARADRMREWLADQRVFVSSAIGDTAVERGAVAAIVEETRARPVWFEEFGRDADAEEAYLGCRSSVGSTLRSSFLSYFRLNQAV